MTGTLIWGLSPVRLRGATGAMIGVEATVSGAAVMWIGRYSRLDGEGQTLCGRDRGADLGSVPGELGGATGAMIGVEATVSGAAVMWIGRYSRLDGEGQTLCGRDRGADLGSVPGEAGWCGWRDDRD